MRIHTHTHKQACTHTHTHTHTQACMHTHTHTQACMHTHTSMHAHTTSTHLHIVLTLIVEGSFEVVSRGHCAVGSTAKCGRDTLI